MADEPSGVTRIVRFGFRGPPGVNATGARGPTGSQGVPGPTGGTGPTGSIGVLSGLVRIMGDAAVALGDSGEPAVGLIRHAYTSGAGLILWAIKVATDTYNVLSINTNDELVVGDDAGVSRLSGAIIYLKDFIKLGQYYFQTTYGVSISDGVTTLRTTANTTTATADQIIGAIPLQPDTQTQLTCFVQARSGADYGNASISRSFYSDSGGVITGDTDGDQVAQMGHSAGVGVVSLNFDIGPGIVYLRASPPGAVVIDWRIYAQAGVM